MDILLRFFFLFFALMLFSSGIVMLMPSSGGEADEPDFGIMVVMNAIFHGGTLLLVIDFLRGHQYSWSHAFGFRNGHPGKVIGLAAAVVPLTIPVAIVLGLFSSLLLELVHVDSSPQKIVEVIQESQSVVKTAYFGLVAIVVAPVVEEILFRGILYPGIKEIGHPRLALWGSAFLFALSHENTMTILPLTFLAIVLTWLYERTDNLLAPIAGHALFNALNFTFLILQDSLLESAPL